MHFKANQKCAARMTRGAHDPGGPAGCPPTPHPMYDAFWGCPSDSCHERVEASS